MMPKRRNPFGDYFQPQMKVHVGNKQFLNTEEKMQSVYEKTLGMLFKAAKLNAAPLPEERQLADIREALAAGNNNDPVCGGKLMKQMFLAKDGTLQKEGTLQSEVYAQCSLCLLRSANSLTRCNYCECSQCELCCAPCNNCHAIVCQRCTTNVPGYTQQKLCLLCCR